jgi:hypothetical protein
MRGLSSSGNDSALRFWGHSDSGDTPITHAPLSQQAYVAGDAYLRRLSEIHATARF